MASFQKPENALKRAEELIGVEKKADALETLKKAIENKKFRNMWTTTIERIMIRHLELCVELKKMRTAREGLYQYRVMCQAANIGSLELVVQRFRKAAEEKVQEAKAQKDLQMAEMGDLDEMEAPQTILLRAIQANDTRQQSQDRDVHMHFRFLWDTYKVVLDVLKSNARLEEVYHDTARLAFDFCRNNQRPQEFKRLSLVLRTNYGDLQKHTGKVPAHQVNPNSQETISRTLDTRCKQLQIATELDLWKEAYQTAQEICDLMSKVRPKPHLRSLYLGYLGQIFWRGENHLFHAFACLKNLMFVKAAKQNLSKDELTLLASKAVLATLCVPFQKNSDMHATLELTTEEKSPYEKAKKHMQLFNVQSVPTRDSIITQLVEKGLLSLVIEPCRKLFALIESDFTPLSLCQDAKPYLDEIAGGEAFDGKLVQYITPLKQIIFFRLMKQLSEVYVTMTIENFERAASIVPFSIAEKWMANAARQHGINVQINYSHKVIVFGAPRKVDMKSMRQPLIEIGYRLQQAMQRVDPEVQHKKEKVEKSQLAQNIVRRIEEETRLIRQRKEEIERRKEESERRKEIQEKEALEKQRQQEAREAEAERIRQNQERRRREAEREEQKRRDAEMVKIKETYEEMKRQAEGKLKNQKVGGIKITDIATEDLEKIGIDQIEKAREAQVQRDRQEKIRQRKMESKRVDHHARALREEEQSCLDEWAHEIEERDEEFLDKAEAANAEEQKRKHVEGLKERDMLLAYKKAKDRWSEEKLQAREEEYREKLEEQERRLEAKVVELKIQRAKKKMEEREKEMAELREKKRRQQEQEKQQREEEERQERERLEEERRQEEAERRAEEERVRKEEAKRQKEEEKREMEEQRQRSEAKRLQKEREIEERQRQEKESRVVPESGGRSVRDRDDVRRHDDHDDVRRRDDRDDVRRRDDRDNDAGEWRRGDPPRGDRDSARGEKPAWGRGGTRADDRMDWRRKGEEDPGPRMSARPSGRDREDDDGGVGAWRRPTTSRNNDGDDWRSGPRGGGGRDDRGGGRDDRGGGRDDRGGGRDDRDPVARRNTDRDRDDNEEEGTWRRGAGRTQPSRAEEAREEGGSAPWRRGGTARLGDEKPRREPDRERERERERDDDPPPRSSRPARQAEPEEKPAPAPPAAAAADEDEDEEEGWSSVTAGKKKKKKDPAAAAPAPRGGAAAGDAQGRKIPPWKTRDK